MSSDDFRRGLLAGLKAAGASEEQMESVRRAHAAIDRYAERAGSTVLKTTPLPDQIRREERQLENLRQILEALNEDGIVFVRKQQRRRGDGD